MRFIKRALSNAYSRAKRVLTGVQKNKVVFFSFNGKSYSDNPRSVSEALHEMMPEAEIFWMMTNPEAKKAVVPEYVKCINCTDGHAVMKHLMSAKVFVSNICLHDIKKSKKQLFIQVWHGDKAFKTILYDSPHVEKTFSITEERPGYCDLAVAGSNYGKKQYESAFRYKGKILMEGTPRNDRLVQNDPVLSQKLKQQLNISVETKILLYAPTLRRQAEYNRQKQEIQNLSLSATLNLLEKKDGSKWVCLLRAHPATVGLSGAEDDPRIMDVSDYEDMADLLLISDMLITDYSPVPVILPF